MKKITVMLLCFLTVCICSVTAFAEEPQSETASTVISVTVPDTHKISVNSNDAKVFYNGVSEDEFVVARLSEPRLLIRADSGKVIKSITLNGEDVTEKLYGGYLELSPVYENKLIEVTTEDETPDVKETYTVRGKVTLDGQPLANVELELRPTLKTVKTDENGCFVIDGVEAGEHTLTALSDQRVIGFLTFELKEDNNTDISLQENGVYNVFVDQKGVGVELLLTLNEEKGTLAPTEVKTVEKSDPNSPQTGDDAHLSLWWLILLLTATCITVLEHVRRKQKFE